MNEDKQIVPTSQLGSSNNIRLYTVRDAAEKLGVSPKMLRDKIDSGEIGYVRWGNQRRIPHWHLEEWQRRQVTSQDDAVEKLVYG